MIRDERIYAFIVAHASPSSIRKISIHRRWLKLSLCVAAAVLCAALYGLYSLSQEVAALHLEDENNRLRTENAKQRQQLHNLKNRVEAVEDATRRLSEISGAAEQEEQQPGQTETNERGAGGPLLILDAAGVAAVEQRAAQLQTELQVYESVLRERARIPSIWPVIGRMTDEFGVRGNPFGGGSAEFHDGQDIATAWGTPVVAASSGTVVFAGVKNGYGQVVILDHGSGLTTSYGHLSRIGVEVGQQLARGEELGGVGSTGRSTGPHLHYEVRINDTAVNPRGYLPEIAATEVEETKP
jgi:murein DD-endopeptidase MepM/ murein hydrolase activator NlpD